MFTGRLGVESKTRRLIKSGFTLVELLVVIAVIGILVALLLPAVQAAREAARRMECANNLKQLTLGCHLHHDQKGTFPPGGWVEPYTAWSNPKDPVTGRPPQKGSWLVFTLPYLEQSALYDQIPELNTPGIDSIGRCPLLQKGTAFPLPYGRCPSDPTEPGGYVNYVGSLGPQCLSNPCGYSPFDQFCHQPAWGYDASVEVGHMHTTFRGPGWLRGMFNRNGVGTSLSNAGIRIADVTDGTSNTLMIGETIIREHDHLYWISNWARPNGGNSHASTIVPINYKTDYLNQSDPCGQPERNNQNWAVSFGFKSQHPGGANFSFADGSVRFVAETIDHRTYQLLGCRHDGQAVEAP
jgi:prepilin-type N-terminal cleavage/methylation domain-containing protein/prepilin-type processing-associated H-X9-DG protein